MKYCDRKKKDTNRLVGKEIEGEVIVKIRTERWEDISIRFLAANR